MTRESLEERDRTTQSSEQPHGRQFFYGPSVGVEHGERSVIAQLKVPPERSILGSDPEIGTHVSRASERGDLHQSSGLHSNHLNDADVVAMDFDRRASPLNEFETVRRDEKITSSRRLELSCRAGNLEVVHRQSPPVPTPISRPTPSTISDTDEDRFVLVGCSHD